MPVSKTLYITHHAFPHLAQAYADLESCADETAELLKWYRNARAQVDGKKEPANERVRTLWQAEKETAAMRLRYAVEELSSSIHSCSLQLDQVAYRIARGTTNQAGDVLGDRFSLAKAHAMWLGADMLVRESQELVAICNAECPLERPERQQFPALEKLYQLALARRTAQCVERS